MVAGSSGIVRWMAPELILALVDEDEHSSDGSQASDSSGSSKPKITTMSDVYAFGSVCLEVCFSPAQWAGGRRKKRVD